MQRTSLPTLPSMSTTQDSSYDKSTTSQLSFLRQSVIRKSHYFTNGPPKMNTAEKSEISKCITPREKIQDILSSYTKSTQKKHFQQEEIQQQNEQNEISEINESKIKRNKSLIPEMGHSKSQDQFLQKNQAQVSSQAINSQICTSPQIKAQKFKSNIQVIVRFRPFNLQDKNKGIRNDYIKIIPPKNLLLNLVPHQDMNTIYMKSLDFQSVRQSEYIQYQFTFQKILDQQCSQSQIFQEIGQECVSNFLKGQSQTIIAFGQSGSGKSYTMYGDTNNGLIQKISTAILKQLKPNYQLQCSYYEIVNEKIRDLTQSGNSSDLKVMEDKSRGVFIDNLPVYNLSNIEFLNNLLKVGSSNKTCVTNNYYQSSKSHTIFTLYLLIQNKVSKLIFVDLMGSDSLNKFGSQEQASASKMNLSLASLNRVIESLAQQPIQNSTSKQAQSFIPYRDSKLTRILQESLGGKIPIKMIVTCSPDVLSLPETLNSLKFGAKAQQVQVKTIVKQRENLPQFQTKLPIQIQQEYQLNLQEKPYNETDLSILEISCIQNKEEINNFNNFKEES